MGKKESQLGGSGYISVDSQFNSKRVLGSILEPHMEAQGLGRNM